MCVAFPCTMTDIRLPRQSYQSVLWRTITRFWRTITVLVTDDSLANTRTRARTAHVYFCKNKSSHAEYWDRIVLSHSHVMCMLLASVECACCARHAQLQKTHLRHAQKKRRKKKKKKKKKSEFGHAMCPNSDTPCSEISFLAVGSSPCKSHMHAFMCMCRHAGCAMTVHNMACGLTCFFQNIDLEIHFPVIFMIFWSSQSHEKLFHLQ